MTFIKTRLIFSMKINANTLNSLLPTRYKSEPMTDFLSSLLRESSRELKIYKPVGENTWMSEKHLQLKSSLIIKKSSLMLIHTKEISWIVKISWYYLEQSFRTSKKYDSKSFMRYIIATNSTKNKSQIRFNSAVDCFNTT